MGGVIEFAADALTPYLKSGAPNVNPALQEPSKQAGTLKAKSAWVDFLPTYETYFITVTAEKPRATLVLGWDHAVILERTAEGYVARSILCQGPKRAFGDLTAGGALKELTKAQTPTVDFEEGGKWTQYIAPTAVLERVVTYGVSSCSFTVLAAPDLRFIAISHISGQPPIPVGYMVAKLKPSKTFRLLASCSPQENEIHKITNDEAVTEAGDPGSSFVMTRGKKPEEGERGRLYPQLMHTDIGVQLWPAAKPRIVGTLGLEEDGHYARLFSTEMALRLKNFSTPASMAEGFLFETSYFDVMNDDELAKVFLKWGHRLTNDAKTKEDQAFKAWTVRDTPGVEGERVYKIMAAVETVDVTTRAYAFATTTATGQAVSWRFIDVENNLVEYLNRKQAYLLKDAFVPSGMPLGADARVDVVKAGAAWKVVNGSTVVDVAGEAPAVVKKPRTVLRYYGGGEPEAIVTDIVRPLLAGAFGFGALHTEVYRAFITRLQTSTAAFRMFDSAFNTFEKAVSTKVGSWAIAAQAQSGFARLLGSFLGSGLDHPYAPAVVALVKTNRFAIDLPLDARIA